MKIGVDARLLSRPLIGISRYTLEMCRALAKMPDVSLYLYSPAPVLTDALAGLESASIRTMHLNNGALRQLWSESYLPLWAKKDQVDVFWGPAHRLPRWLPDGMPRVVTIHDLVWKHAGDTMRPVTRMLERLQMPLAVRAADKIVTDSQATAVAVNSEFAVDANDLSVVPPGVVLGGRTEPFDSLLQYGVDRPYFLFVGTLEPRKNLIRLLTAYSRLPETVKERAMLVITGGKGWGGINLRDTVTGLGLARHVRLPGYVDEPTLNTLYAHALFLAMPSLYEGFGLPIVEAMAHGVPVLTSDNSSMPEVAGEAGLFVDALSIDSIADGLGQLLGNEDLRDKLAANARSNAARFNWNEAAQQLITVFKEAIAKRKTQLL